MGGPRDGQQGQGLVEFTVAVPILVIILVSMVEFGLAFVDQRTIGYGSREGARVGSALATGGVNDCSGGTDPSGVDATLVATIQRILDSPGSAVSTSDVEEVRIFKATSTGAETPGTVNVWRFAGVGGGPDMDPGPGVSAIDFSPFVQPWPACSRVNSTPNPDSIGVTVVYRYTMVTPLAAVIGFIGGSTSVSFTMTETTVMALNPTI